MHRAEDGGRRTARGGGRRPVRAAEDGNRRTAREEAVTAGVGAAKANGRRARRRGTAAGAADDTAAASGKPTFFICMTASHPS